MSPSDVFEPAEFASVFFFLFLCKKGERKKGSSECGPSLLKNNAAEARACKPGVPTCVFLSEKSTLFVVSGFAAQCRGPAFFLFMGGPQKRVAAADWPRATRAKSCGQSNAGGMTRVDEKKGSFLFLGEKRLGDALFTFWAVIVVGAQLLRPWGIGTAAKTTRAAAAQGGARGGNLACRGLRPPF